MHQSLAQHSHTGVPDLVIPHGELYQRGAAAENGADLLTAIAGYAAVLQPAEESAAGVTALLESRYSAARVTAPLKLPLQTRWVRCSPTALVCSERANGLQTSAAQLGTAGPCAAQG